MTVSHFSRLINIHIISDDNLKRFASDGASLSKILLSRRILKSFFELYFIECWRFAGWWHQTLVCIWVLLQFCCVSAFCCEILDTGMCLFFSVRVSVCVCVCVCEWLNLSSADEQAWEFSREQMKSSGAAWKGSRDREDGVGQISLRSDWFDWNGSVCVVTLCVCVIMCVCSLSEWCLYKLKRPPIGLRGSWEPALSGSPLAISSHTPTTHTHTHTHTHTNIGGCSVTWSFSQLLCLPVSAFPSRAH